MKLTISELRKTIREVLESQSFKNNNLKEVLGGKLPKIDPITRRKIESFAFDISTGSDELQPYGYSGGGRLPPELVTRLGEILGVLSVSSVELKYFTDVLDSELMGMESP